jgi:hypothetical protein
MNYHTCTVLSWYQKKLTEKMHSPRNPQELLIR